MKLRFIVILLVLLCANVLYSQTKFISGYVVSNSNDTTRGLISFKSLNPYNQICQFKSSDSSAVELLKPTEISSFGTNDVLMISAREFDRISGQKKPNGFFKVVFEGKLDILIGSYKRYFIRSDTSEFLYPLNNKDFLFFLTSNDPSLSKQIKDISFTENSLVDLMKNYHDNLGYSSYTIYLPTETVQAIDFFVTGGYAGSVLSLFNNTGNRVFDISVSPSVGGGLEYFPAIRSKQSIFSVNFQLRFNYNLFQNRVFTKTSTSIFHEDILFESYSLKFPFGFKIRSLINENTAFYVNPCLFLQTDFPSGKGRRIIDSGDNNQITYKQDQIEYFRSITLGLFVAGGIEKKIKNKQKVSIEICYELSGDNNFIMNTYSIHVSTTLISKIKK